MIYFFYLLTIDKLKSGLKFKKTSTAEVPHFLNKKNRNRFQKILEMKIYNLIN